MQKRNDLNCRFSTLIYELWRKYDFYRSCLSVIQLYLSCPRYNHLYGLSPYFTPCFQTKPYVKNYQLRMVFQFLFVIRVDPGFFFKRFFFKSALSNGVIRFLEKMERILILKG